MVSCASFCCLAITTYSCLTTIASCQSNIFQMDNINNDNLRTGNLTILYEILNNIFLYIDKMLFGQNNMGKLIIFGLKQYLFYINF